MVTVGLIELKMIQTGDEVVDKALGMTTGEVALTEEVCQLQIPHSVCVS